MVTPESKRRDVGVVILENAILVGLVMVCTVALFFLPDTIRLVGGHIMAYLR